MASFPLLTADALIGIGAVTNALFPPWGIYLNGAPVISPPSLINQTIAQVVLPLQNFAAIFSAAGFPGLVPVTASVVKWEFKQDWNIADYPIEDGGFQSYDKVQLPFDVRVTLAAGGAPTQRQAFLATIDKMANSLGLFDIQTPEKVYRSCNVSHFDFDRRSNAGVELLAVSVWFQQVRVTASTSPAAQQPGNATQQSLGNIQSIPAVASITKLFSSFGGAN